MTFVLDHALTVLSFLLTLVFVSFLLRARKPAGSTMAWLFLIVTIPYIGIPLYLMFSDRKILGRLHQKNRLRVKTSKPSAAPEILGIQKMLESSGAPAPERNQSIQILATGVMAFDRYVELIDRANKSIHVTTFIFGNDDTGRGILKALTKRAKDGIDVRVIVDSFGGTLIRHPSLAEFKKAGGRIGYFMPLLHVPFRGRSNLRNHRKLLITDGSEAIVGGMNLATEYMGPVKDPNRWTDLAVHIKGASVTDLENIFLQDWAFARHDRRQDPAGEEEPHQPISADDAKIWAQVVPTGPDVPGDPIYDVLLSSIFSAQSEILIITPYFIPDESLAKALEIAAKRGVNVRVLLPRKSNHALADIARGSFIRQLLSVGVEFHFYTKMIHAKAVLIDQAVGLVGSANFDMRSLLLNYELGVLVYDELLLKEIREWSKPHLQDATFGYPPGNFWRQTLEGIGRVVGPFI